VKRVDFVRHLEHQGCRLLREGANHAIYINQDGTAVRICRLLLISAPLHK